ncbi:hypothetical protein K2P97_11115 [bacterium]|nr:hypothetical protein [bacterium]
MNFFASLLILIQLTSARAEFSPYNAQVSDLDADQKKILFDIKADKKIIDENLYLDVSVLDKNSEIAIRESAIVNKNSAEIIEYKITNNQTRERGVVTVKDKIIIEYTDPENKTKTKEFAKPSRLVAPANFELWIIRNFELLKKEKSLSVDFLIWDRLETIKFKVTYMGEQSLDGENSQLFKMNIDNFLLAAFISPIKIWYKADMSEIKLYEGRVAVRKKNSSGKYDDLDGRVTYTYK